MAKIKVYRKDTGEIVYVPEHWMDHPVLKDPFRKTPSQKSRELALQAEAEAAPELAALAQKTSVPRAGETAKSTNPNESANAGDDKKE